MLMPQHNYQGDVETKNRGRERQRVLDLAHTDTSTSPRRTRLSRSAQLVIALLVVVGMLFWFHLL